MVYLLEKQSRYIIMLIYNGKILISLLFTFAYLFISLFVHLFIIQASKKEHLMNNNILGINPSSNKFFDIAYNSLASAVVHIPTNRLQIEFKYAELRSLITPYNKQLYKDLPQQAVTQLQYQSTSLTDQFLKTLSNQNVLYLNPLGSKSYLVAAGFDQKANKKFYHIRQMLLKVAEFNKKNNYNKADIGKAPYHIYKQLSQNNNSHQFRLKQDNQLRLDLYIKQKAPAHLQGRYSYSSNEGWIKTIKKKMSNQLDYLMSQRYYRMAINQQEVQRVEANTLNQLSQYCKSVTKPFDIRLKRSLRVLKGNIYEISMSQILNLSDVKLCNQLGQLIFQTNYLQTYIKKLFINFYALAEQEDHLSWEIQLQFTSDMNLTFKELVIAKREDEVKRKLQNSMEELHTIIFADHTVKTKESVWLNRNMPKDAPTDGRLDNQYGTYMREHLYRQMEAEEFNK